MLNVEDVNIDDRGRVFPSIKDNLYLNNVKNLGAEEGKIVYQRLNSELLIFYVIDSDTHVSSLGSDDLESMNLNKAELYELSIKNLGGYLPELKIEGDPGELSMLVADGHYESSLILFDDIWTKDNFPVKGDIVVFIPTRDLVMVTGSGEVEGLKRAREIMDNPENHWSHIVSEKSFIRKDGKWEAYDK